ncbi:poly(ADP-ribose) glycohydrolase-like isoform X2 [Scyliorhinus torazame]|uniref:poly(ADP-ribose) glycohydrolase-like isoform X2 n=1 Tax=Scyliorhinus torazame TaxID=75743 RepID=UPI003B5BF145
MNDDRTRSDGLVEGNSNVVQPGWGALSDEPHCSGDACPSADGKGAFENPAPSYPELPPLEPSASHTICVEVSALKSRKVIPFKVSGAEDFWSSEFVKMPFSNHSTQTRTKPFLRSVEVKRWKVIKQALDKAMFETTRHLEDAIKEYNQKYAHDWKFSGLHRHFDQPIPLLKEQRAHAITMSQEQAACLLANAFFCTFPHRNSTHPNAEYGNFPNINFSRLFVCGSPRTSQKLKAIFCYFSKVTEAVPKGLVTFQRCCLNAPIVWKRSARKLRQLRVNSEGRIEEEEGKLQVDFASPMVGGGVLGTGLVQEEIRFLINPELILARLFTEKLAPNECLVVTGAQRYSEYEGYSDSYRWLRYHNDETARDTWLRCRTEIVAIDAVKFENCMDQYKTCFLDRELHKAYCGFSAEDRVISNSYKPAVVTGNWGCGAYRGDPELKALIQLMAAAQAERDVVYFTFGDTALEGSLRELHQLLQRKEVTVGQLYEVLERYSRKVSGLSEGRDLYQFILSNVGCLKGRI